MAFKKAVKDNLKARIALVGPAKSGKTMTSLIMAGEFGGNIAVIDTEFRSASKYADMFEFDVEEIEDFSPDTYIKAIEEAAGYDVLVIDSLSHAWMGKGGVLDIVDKATRTNKFTEGWATATPKHLSLIEAMHKFPGHLIVTMRAKTAYTMEEYTDGGKTKVKPVKIGTAPIQRDGMEFEFDVWGDLDRYNTLTIQETRVPALRGQTFEKPGADVASIIKDWLKGEPLTEEERKRFHALGSILYGDDWDNSRHKLVGWVTNGRTQSSNDLTKSEMVRLIIGMEKKQGENTPQMISAN